MMNASLYNDSNSGVSQDFGQTGSVMPSSHARACERFNRERYSANAVLGQKLQEPRFMFGK
jgi:hypothetical protein